MPEYLAPGVYVEEFEMGAKPIEGVSTSTLGILGETERGPVAPKLITSFEEFRRTYGGYLPKSYLAYAMEGFFTNGGQRAFVGRITGSGGNYAGLGLPGAAGAAKDAPAPKGKPGEPEKKTNGKAGGPVLMLRALGPGLWGNRVAIKVEDAGLANMNPNLFKLTIAYWKEAPSIPIVDPTDQTKEKDPNRREPKVLEIYDNLSPDPASSDNYEKKINDVSVVIEIKKLGAGRPANMPFQFLRDGKDGSAVTLSDYKGTAGAEPGNETGLLAFKEIDDISIVVVPNENDIMGLTGEVIAHCELMKDRFAVTQAKQSAGPLGKLMPPTDSQFAAFYYPWIKVVDPLTQGLKLIPPGGHMAGIYARSDTERGVHKAPANEVVRGVSALQFSLSKAKQDILNPRGVNCIRAFTGRGIRIWGARTISSDPLWKYINVRRLFLFIEESIDKGTQWVVFEPNNEALWARVTQTINQFLHGVWRTGALMGTTPEQGYFVKCDRSTMTQDDIDNGRLVCVIGVCPTKPAEFVIFRIAQWTASA